MRNHEQSKTLAERKNPDSSPFWCELLSKTLNRFGGARLHAYTLTLLYSCALERVTVGDRGARREKHGP
eukprot:376715-Prorocentrum_minimum.AAC.1